MFESLGWSVRFVIGLKGIDMWLVILVIGVAGVGTVVFDGFRVVDGPVRSFRESVRTKKARDIEVTYEIVNAGEAKRDS